ncbi:MAG: pyrroloquinoline quinone-dependent dehydrogenase [Myxococcales bacterium]|nr:pyrroloquinoline quinone-dependent dehydrogenase [Myxococcales bacterium]
MTPPRRLFTALALASAAALIGCDSGEAIDYSGPTGDWPIYQGDPGAMHYSPLDQVHRGNVADLEVAWTHRSGDYSDGRGEVGATTFQATPIVVNDTMYYCTPFQRVFALDPETGEEKWVFDPELRLRGGAGPYPLNCRGVTYWEEPRPKPGQECQRRILHGTRDSELIALDADTGLPCSGFGDNGRVALREGIGEAPPWEYYPTSPVLAIDDLVVIGALIADNLRIDAPSGVVRAFDVRSGRLVWAWDPVPPAWKKDPNGPTYALGTPNVWSILTGDAERHLVFVPTGNPAPDLFGGLREGIDYYGSSTVALDSRTGEVVWHFQTVHHDVWDFDAASPPTLFQIPGVAEGAPAVAQPTKMGMIFLLHRETGEPLYPVEERPVPQGGVPGEKLSPTQPFPTHPEPLHPTEITPDNVFGFTPWDRGYCADLVRSLKYEGPYTPPSFEGSIQTPHTTGGMNWGGVAIDPVNGLLFTNQTHMALVNQIVTREEAEQLDLSEIHYPNELYLMTGTPYAIRRFPLMSNFGAPCNEPPWGSLQAVDLRTGEVRWRVSLGTTRDQAPPPLWFDLGAPNFGGGIVTAGGIYLIAATTDHSFRAFDIENGEEIWTQRIPVPGNSVPMTYRLGPDRKQFIVLAAGGTPLSKVGDHLIAYTLPN